MSIGRARAGAGGPSRPSGPFLEFAPSTNGTYDFGQVEVGRTASQLFTITNTGTKPTSPLSLTFSGSDRFAISDDACSGVNLHPGDSATFLLGYTPDNEETVSGTAIVTGHRPRVTQGLYVKGDGFILPPQRHLYWTSLQDGAIGRANLDGTHVDLTFITGLSSPADVAVDAGHIYWADNLSGTIGRANLDGTGANPTLIAGLYFPIDVAVDAGHIYWAGGGSIGRANLDGTDVDLTFITGLDSAVGLAVDNSHIYWVDQLNYRIGRANLDGTDVNGSFITGLEWAVDVAVDAGHIFWGSTGAFRAGEIGRADLDGTGVDLTFIPDLVDSLSVAVDSERLYWTDSISAQIGIADLGGTNVNRSYITGLYHPLQVAVDAG